MQHTGTGVAIFVDVHHKKDVVVVMAHGWVFGFINQSVNHVGNGVAVTYDLSNEF